MQGNAPTSSRKGLQTLLQRRQVRVRVQGGRKPHTGGDGEKVIDVRSVELGNGVKWPLSEEGGAVRV
jgi:hypothetical protein